MPEPNEPEAFEQPAPPRGPIRHGWFGGILEGRRGDVSRLRAAVRRINSLGLCRAELEIDGGHFNVLLDDKTLPGEVLGADRSQAFLELLQELVDASAEPGQVESTLHCTEVYEDQAVDSMFAPVGGRMQCVSNLRPMRESDRRAISEIPDQLGLQSLGVRRAAMIGSLFLLAFGLLTWQTGLIDRLLSAEPTELARDTGPFHELLELELEGTWGNYSVRVRRGPSYPASAKEVESLLAAATTTVERAAVNAVADGGTVYVRMRNEAGQLLESRPIELAPLLVDSEGRAEIMLHGFIRAHTLELALDRGESGPGTRGLE